MSDKGYMTTLIIWVKLYQNSFEKKLGLEID